MLWSDRDQALSEAAASSGADFPTTAGELFSAAWARNDALMQNVSGESDRLDALGDYLDTIKQKGGPDLAPELDYGTFGGGMMPDSMSLFRQANGKLAEYKQKNPTFDFAPMTPEELDQNALNKRRAADADFGALVGRPRGRGATAGLIAGGMAASAVEPVNILTLPLAPAEGLGVVAKALQWGAIGAGVSAAQEALTAPYEERVHPGYIESGAPLEIPEVPSIPEIPAGIGDGEQAEAEAAAAADAEPTTDEIEAATVPAQGRAKGSTAAGRKNSAEDSGS